LAPKRGEKDTCKAPFLGAKREEFFAAKNRGSKKGRRQQPRDSLSLSLSLSPLPHPLPRWLRALISGTSSCSWYT